MRKGVELSPIENNARRSRRSGAQGGRETDRIERRDEGVGRETDKQACGREGGGGGGRAGGAPGGAFYGEQRTVSRCVRLQRRA